MKIPLKYKADGTVQPLTPEEVGVKKTKTIPAEVIEAFNEMLVKKFDGQYAKINQDLILESVQEKLPGVSIQEIFENKYLDVEDVFADYGWKVTYTKPTYVDNFPPYFTFVPKSG